MAGQCIQWECSMKTWVLYNSIHNQPRFYKYFTVDRAEAFVLCSLDMDLSPNMCRIYHPTFQSYWINGCSWTQYDIKETVLIATEFSFNQFKHYLRCYSPHLIMEFERWRDDSYNGVTP